MRAGDADLETVAPFTSDADFSIDTTRLGADPDIAQAMGAAGFALKIKNGDNGIEPGAWLTTTDVGGKTVTIEVDLMVPEALAPVHGSRDARLPEHSKNAARWAPGLEAAVLDNDPMMIGSLEPECDQRTAVLRVAGSAALLIAKAHKLGERVGSSKTHRIKPKDAGDVFRLMRSPTPPDQIGHRLAELARTPLAADSIRVGIGHLDRLFGNPRATGVELALTNLAGAVSEDELRAVMPTYIHELLDAYQG